MNYPYDLLLRLCQQNNQGLPCAVIVHRFRFLCVMLFGTAFFMRGSA